MNPPLFNAANVLSALRILLVPLFVWLVLRKEDAWALGIFVGASLTDYLDGWLARRFHLVTPLGIILDPIGDKLLVLSAFLTLAAQGRLEAWMAVVAVGREVLVITGILLLAGFAGKSEIQRDIKSTFFGKLGTFLVMVLLALNLGALAGLFPPGWGQPLRWGLALGLLLNLASGIDYAVKGFRYYGHYRHR